ncbi:hypothetical protein [Achromobacter pestifer]|uniref:Uncharacterized protein n=1 Tax=Achromobacter pestifer TaxID=1353889 RepID=A0A6S6ZFQ6_9BURK|nr:hypothetical protein [Achromobacter pestifer]CAB3672191.1 hypothetical protein LMG3431_03905 [Achromobacter pestifer]
MNTADISVLSDELAVTLNPLRRGAHRARAACARLAGLAMPWNTSSADAQPRHRVRPGSMPVRWPFPPAPVDDGVTGQAVAVPVPTVTPAVAPAVAPVVPNVPGASVVRERSLGNATVEPVTSQVTMKAMVIDVVMVLAWGAIIPGLMWLGAAAGF